MVAVRKIILLLFMCYVNVEGFLRLCRLTANESVRGKLAAGLEARRAQEVI